MEGLVQTIRQISAERGIDPETIFAAIESAMVATARKSLPRMRNLRVSVNRETGTVQVFSTKRVVEEVKDYYTEISVAEAKKKLGRKPKIGEEIEDEVNPDVLGRIAAQTAKQVVIQRIREAQRENVYEEYKTKIGTIVSGVALRSEKEGTIIDLGRTEALLPIKEQPRGMRLRQGDRIRCLVLDVRPSAKGPQIILSRTHPDLILRMFEQQVPEIVDGIVKIRAIAREAGDRTKIAVESTDKQIDPVGACVGTKGVRVQDIVKELVNEKIDIIHYSDDPKVFITNAISPAKVIDVKIDEVNHTALVIVAEDQLSLAIGKHGQNARLAARLTNWKIDIISDKTLQEHPKFLEPYERQPVSESSTKSVENSEINQLVGLGPKLTEKLIEAGYTTITQLAESSVESLAQIPGIGAKTAEKLIATAKKALK
ncbi:MAG: transcription termination factor NusA [bacterium]|nr:transcription termination factor NusA [bacterium]